MNPEIEKLEQLLSQGKHDSAILNKFHNELWLRTTP
jgi:hypothetical protein